MPVAHWAQSQSKPSRSEANASWRKLSVGRGSRCESTRRESAPDSWRPIGSSNAFRDQRCRFLRRPPSLPVVGQPRHGHEKPLGSATRWGRQIALAFCDGPGALKLLGGRVEERPDLKLRILLNVRLGTGDRTRPGDLLRRLADDFRGSARPGSNRPFTAPLVRWTWSGRMQRCTHRLASQMMQRSSRRYRTSRNPPATATSGPDCLRGREPRP